MLSRQISLILRHGSESGVCLPILTSVWHIKDQAGPHLSIVAQCGTHIKIIRATN